MRARRQRRINPAAERVPTRGAGATSGMDDGERMDTSVGVGT